MTIPHDARASAPWPPEFLGPSSVMARTRKQALAAAASRARALITGPPGSGKSLTARLIHLRSPRARAACVRLACASPALAEADEARQEALCDGALERARAGTLVVDDVDCAPPAVLAWLARMAARRMDAEADVHTLALTRVDLAQAVKEGAFPADLRDRLAVTALALPPLEDRPEDIPDVARAMAARYARRRRAATPQLDDNAVAWLQTRAWPGGLEEMRGFVEWSLDLAWAREGKRARVAEPPRARVSSGALIADFANMNMRAARADFERLYLRAQLDRFGGNKTAAAGFVGMARPALHLKLRALGLAGADETGR